MLQQRISPPEADFRLSRHEVFSDVVKTAKGDLRALVAKPHIPDSGAPLVVVHGIRRDPVALLSRFAEAAPGRLIVAPHFDEVNWRTYQRLTKRRPDKALLDLVGALRGYGLMPGGRFDLFGFSGGAQFAHRFAMIYPLHVGALHLGAAGWYTMPDEAAPWPYGLGQPEGGSRWPERAWTARAAFLDLPIRIYVGENDNAPDEALRRSPALDAAQGENRRARAHAYAAALRAAADKAGVAGDVGVTELPGCDHDFNTCADTGGLARLVAGFRKGSRDDHR